MKPIAINTHIDCANNSKCSVRDILRATKQGALESVFVHFLLYEVISIFYCLYKGATGSSVHILKFSFQSALFSFSMAMRILFRTFQFAKSIFRVLKCEAAIFDKYHSAWVNGTSISNSWRATCT